MSVIINFDRIEKTAHEGVAVVTSSWSISADRPPAMPESINQVADGRWSRVTEGRVSTVRETWVVSAY